MKRLCLVGAAIGLSAALAIPGWALAEEAARIDIDRSDGVTWVEATVASGNYSDVSIKIYNVRKGSRTLWQRCNFDFDGPNVYRCGIDSEPGSLAHRQPGSWLAKVFLDGEQAAKKRFSL